MNRRFVHDEAWQAGNAIMNVFESMLRAAEVKDAHTLVFERVKAAIDSKE